MPIMEAHDDAIDSLDCLCSALYNLFTIDRYVGLNVQPCHHSLEQAFENAICFTGHPLGLEFNKILMSLSANE